MNYLNILEEAHKKAVIALEACKPTPVSWVSVDLMDKPLAAPSEADPEGECGGAYITGLHGRDPFVTWMKKQNEKSLSKICNLSKGVYKGYDLYLSKGTYRGQSYERNVAFAKAFSGVLNENGIKCSIRDYLT